MQPFDEYEIKNLVNERLALFVCSTVNEGDEPNQMRRFWRFIMKRGLPSDCLGALRFGTIALGDSSYRRFAVAGKKLHRRLTLLGAQSIVALCVGDDQHDLGFNATVDPWLREYWRAVDTLVVPPIDLNTGKPIDLAKEDDLPAPLFEIVFLDSKPSAPSIQTINIKTSLPTANQARPTENRTSSAVLRSYSSFAPDELDEYENETAVTNTRSNVVAQVGSLQSCDFNHDIQNPYWARVISNERVTDASHWQETRLLRLHMPSHQMPYKSNDVIHVMPSNSDQDVRCLLNIYNLTGMERVQVHRRRKMIGGRCVFDALSDRVLTTRELFTRYVCFSTRPKQSLFELLWRVADREMERDKLKLLASENGVGELLEYVTRPRRTALEVLVDFERVAKFWPIQRLLDLLSPLEPRRFSIAGSSGTCPNELQILYAVVEFKTRMQTPRLGVCTSYLRTLTAGARLPCFIRPGTLRLPPDSKTPLILIATGTGVAPMRSLIEQRAENNVSNNFLFFGCRGRTLDMYFADEWAELNARGLLYYYTAFSRQAINPSHIQHRLWEQRQLLWHLLATCDAYVYVAGRAGPMPRDVRATLLRMLKDQGADQLPDNQAEVLLDRLEQKGRIQYECWC